MILNILTVSLISKNFSIQNYKYSHSLMHLYKYGNLILFTSIYVFFTIFSYLPAFKIQNLMKLPNIYSICWIVYTVPRIFSVMFTNYYIFTLQRFLEIFPFINSKIIILDNYYSEPVVV